MANILWMDGDRTFISPFINRLELQGHTVKQAFTIREAEDLLADPKEALGAEGSWDLVLMDVMMSVKPDGNEDRRYSKEKTKAGQRTGVIFYESNRKRIAELGAVAAFLTMRNDREFKDELVDLGVPTDVIMHKMHLADTRDFARWVAALLN